eukprot:10589833-Alexandrium_andersonii.AAC.1
MLAVAVARKFPGPRIDCLEMFCGVKSITRGMTRRGFAAVGFDCFTVDAADDLVTTSGFLRALNYVVHLEPDGLLWAAP